MRCVVSTYLHGAFDCMLLSCHVRVWEWIYTLQSGCEFESRCCHLKLRYGACFKQGVFQSNAPCSKYDSIQYTISIIFPRVDKIYFSVTKYIWHLKLWQHYAWQISLPKSYKFSYHWSCILSDAGHFMAKKRPTLKGQIVIYKLLETSIDCWIESQYHNAFTWKFFCQFQIFLKIKCET